MRFLLGTLCENAVIMRIQTLYKRYTGSFYTGGRSFLLCSVLLLLVAVAVFIWLSTHVGDQRMLKYMLYASSVVLVMAGLTLYSIFAFRAPEKASKLLWIPLVAAVGTFIAALLVKDPEPTRVDFYDGSPAVTRQMPTPRP